MVWYLVPATPCVASWYSASLISESSLSTLEGHGGSQGSTGQYGAELDLSKFHVELFPLEPDNVHPKCTEI